MGKLLYPLVIMVVVVVYAKTAQHVIGAHEVRSLAAMLTVDLGKIVDGIVEIARALARMVTA